MLLRKNRFLQFPQSCRLGLHYEAIMLLFKKIETKSFSIRIRRRRMREAAEHSTCSAYYEQYLSEIQQKS